MKLERVAESQLLTVPLPIGRSRRVEHVVARGQTEEWMMTLWSITPSKPVTVSSCAWPF